MARIAFLLALLAAVDVQVAMDSVAVAAEHGGDVSSPEVRSGDQGSIGIRLLDTPIEPTGDPRARAYVVDHVRPGARFSRRFAVNNTSDRRQHVALYAAAAEIGDSSFTMAEGRTPNELTSWMSLDRATLDLPPHGSATAAATFAVPESASTGERYAVIWAEVTSSEAGPTGNFRLVTRVGLRVYLDVGTGDAPPPAFAIESLMPGRDKTGAPRVRARVRNMGTRALDLTGSVALVGGSAPVTAPPPPVGRGTTLAPDGTGALDVGLDDPVGTGPEKATLVVAGGGVTRSVSATLTFPTARESWGSSVPIDAAKSRFDSPPGEFGVVGALVLLAAAALTAGILIGVGRRRGRERVVGPREHSGSGKAVQMRMSS
jgi:hypothetical protein